MDIRQLKYFLAIAEEKSITAAANKLHISQPPLSHQLKLLEEELGVTLCKRKVNGLELTDAGLLLIRHARKILDQFNDTISVFEKIRSGNNGQLYIGTITSAAISSLPLLIKEFMKTHHNIEFQIFEGSTAAIHELFNNHEIEVGIVREPFDHSAYNYIYDQADKSDFFVATALPEFFEGAEIKADKEDGSLPSISIRVLKQKPLIVHRIYQEKIIDICKKYDFMPRIISSNENVISSLTWAIMGLGISILPVSSFRLSVILADGHKLAALKLEPAFFSNAALIWRKEQYIAPIAKEFIKFIKRGNQNFNKKGSAQKDAK